jgi:Ni,Fe-hydrogenase I cytochrome b subunit
MMLLMATQFWWASFGLAGREHWNFAAFSAVLLQTVMMYMGTTVVLPKRSSEEPIDLKAHYYGEATPFFAFGLLFLLVGFVKDWQLDQSFVRPFSLHFMLFFTGVTLLALIVRKPIVHEVIAPVMALAVMGYFLMLFMQL